MEYDVLNPKCPTQQVLDRVASKWTMLVILALRALERDGLIERRIYETVRIQTEYELTASGRSLGNAVSVIRTWAYDHMPAIEAARQGFDAPRD